MIFQNVNAKCESFKESFDQAYETSEPETQRQAKKKVDDIPEFIEKRRKNQNNQTTSMEEREKKKKRGGYQSNSWDRKKKFHNDKHSYRNIKEFCMKRRE